uniref:Aquaporin n=1 Tax=Lepeophtheirus salmonis TaxID=72036 RepID=D3PG11_LEPSM|nr:Aquaporin [Lepeophtheirus salmonis]
MSRTVFNWKIIRTFASEFFVSFLFGFTAYSSGLVVSIESIEAGPILIGLALGFSGIALIYSFLDVTVAHFNPAITLSAMVFCKIPFLMGLGFILSRILGFLAASAIVLGCFSGSSEEILNTILPKPVSDSISTLNIILTEGMLAGILVFVAFAVSINKHKKPVHNTVEDDELLESREDTAPDTTILGPLCIGLTLGFLALLGASSSGGAYNPALVFAPVLLTGRWADSWKYWVGEFVGGILGAVIQILLMGDIIASY